MAAPILNSVSPLLSPPGAVITLTGSGFDPGARVACPALVATTFVSSTQLTAVVPDLALAAGASVQIGVFVVNEDGSTSGLIAITVAVPADRLQTWTTIDAVCGEIPAFKRGGRISDDTIRNWMESVAQAIAAAMMRRGLPLDASLWQQPGLTASPSPAAVLELINRLGAAARLAAALGSEFGSQEMGLAAALRRDYEAERKRLEEGGYDVMFRPAARTVESGPLFSAGDVLDAEGNSMSAFTKGQKF
jgi:hypothetical protein